MTPEEANTRMRALIDNFDPHNPEHEDELILLIEWVHEQWQPIKEWLLSLPEEVAAMPYLAKQDAFSQN